MTFLTYLRKFFIKTRHVEDFGHELYINFLNFGLIDRERTPVKWSAIPIAMRWDSYPGRPELSLSVGGYNLFSFSLRLYKLAFSFSLIPLFLTYEPNDLDF
jgi:hypothetical protein